MSRRTQFGRALPVALLCVTALAPSAAAQEVRIQGTQAIFDDANDHQDILGFYAMDGSVKASNRGVLTPGAGCERSFVADGTAGVECKNFTPARMVANLGGPMAWNPVKGGQVDNTLTTNAADGTPIEINGGPGADFVIVGNNRPGDDPQVVAGPAATMRLGAGYDRARSIGGRDGIIGGDGADQIESGNGNDTVYAGDDDEAPESPVYRDTIDCGAGTDTVFADPGDKVKNCETVNRIKPTRDTDVIGDVTLGNAKVTRKSFAIDSTCFAPATCAGTMTLAVKRTKLGKAKFSIKSGRKVRVKIKLSAAGRKLLARKGDPIGRVTAKPRSGAPSAKSLGLK